VGKQSTDTDASYTDVSFQQAKKMWKLEKKKYLAKNSRLSSNFYTNMATVRIYEM
jgi:hypothetical protein